MKQEGKMILETKETENLSEHRLAQNKKKEQIRSVMWLINYYYPFSPTLFGCFTSKNDAVLGTLHALTLPLLHQTPGGKTVIYFRAEETQRHGCHTGTKGSQDSSPRTLVMSTVYLQGNKKMPENCLHYYILSVRN